MQSLKKQQEAGIILFWCIVMSAVLIVACSLCHAAGTGKEREYSSVEICDAIYRAEGGAKASHLYGVMVKYVSVGEAQEICLRTVRHKKKDWQAAGSKVDFIEYLGSRYCPVGYGKDNKYWVRNVKYFLNHKNGG